MTSPITHLNGKRLLVVEDEAFVALMLEALLEGFGCDVVGVAGTLSRGLEYAADEDLAIDGAVLDINLGGEKVFPVAQRLVARGVPFIFCTGYGAEGVPGDFAGVPTLAKPYLEETLKTVLESQFGKAA
jgi:CheY-like chemotaxis protein